MAIALQVRATRAHELGDRMPPFRANRNFRASADSTIDGTHLNPDDTIRLEHLP